MALNRGDYVGFIPVRDPIYKIDRWKGFKNSLFKVEVVTVDNKVKLVGNDQLYDARHLKVVSVQP